MDEQKPGSVVSPNSQTQPPQEVSLQIPRDTIVVPEVPAQIQIPAMPESPTLAQLEQSLGVTRASAVQASESQPVTTPTVTEEITRQEQPYVQDTYDVDSTQQGADSHVSWTASEFIDHAKSLNWYLLLGIVGLVGAVGVYFWTKDIISAAAIVIVALLFGVGAGRKPRVLPYEINESGIQIDTKHYSFNEFKTFSLIHDGGPFSSIQLMPLKRFAPPVSMYFAPEDEDAIATALSNYLPYEERKMDATDRLLRKLRF